MTDTLLHSSAVPGDAIFSTLFSKPGKGQLARLAAHWMKSSVAIVSANGDIDQTNARTLTEYSLAHLVRCRGLILDLTRLDFLGAEGFSALHRISVGCARAGIDWALVPGAAASLLLRICDPDGWLPAVNTVSAALASLQGSASDPDHPGKTCGIGDMG
ncbi:STAS domain-containing protein [Mycobacterium sp.]|uniref:STAS domain-containing protein n=1 Tax=Mycobacterium sp. TaxID=1785 RepID=UPI003F9B2587